MKKINVVVATAVLLVLCFSGAFAQEINRGRPQAIKSYSLTITCEKTTHLVFPYAITTVDRGSQAVLAQKAKGTGNVLQVKAGSRGFPETNLTVITADGKLYSFLVNYADHPEVLNLKFEGKQEKKKHTATVFFSSGKNAAKITAYAKRAYGHRETVRGGHDKKQDVDLRLTGLFIHEEVMYYRLEIENRSAINYTLGQLRFFIRDKRNAKRTASQEIAVSQLFVYNNTRTVKGGRKHTLVVAVPKFTIPDKKRFVIQLIEKNGGRQLELDINNKKLVRLMEPLE